MSKLTLWGHPRSINVQKVLWGLDELGLAYERIDAGGTFGKNKDPDYLAKNPNGLIPTLVEDGEPLWESNAILRYLFTKHGAAPLQPATALLRARADAWTEWYTTTLWINVRPLVVQLVRTPEDKRDRKVIDDAHAASTAAVQLLDRELDKHPYLVGADFTWADIPVGSALQRWYKLPIERPKTPALDAYYARVAQRAPFQRWIELPLT
ncbi:MAG: glutathione S-transferase family protein [Polyangiales bacterium]